MRALPTLHTTRTILEPLTVQDFEEILAMYAEKDSNKFIEPLKDTSRDVQLSFLEKKIKTNQNKNGLGFWTIRLKDGQFIGTANLNLFEMLGKVHIGIHLSREFWGSKFATEVLTSLLKYGVSDLQLEQISGFVEEGNVASMKLMKTIGLQKEKELTIGSTLLHEFTFK